MKPKPTQPLVSPADEKWMEKRRKLPAIEPMSEDEVLNRKAAMTQELITWEMNRRGMPEAAASLQLRLARTAEGWMVEGFQSPMLLEGIKFDDSTESEYAAIEEVLKRGHGLKIKREQITITSRLTPAS